MSTIREVDIRDGIVPISKAAASLSEMIKKARTNNQPIVITQNGHPSAVILDIDSFVSLRELAEANLTQHSDKQGQ